MKTEKELQIWLNQNPISHEESGSVIRWIYSGGEYSESVNFSVSTEGGKTLQDVIDFVNSTSPQTDLNPLVAQFEKVEKEIAKLRKLINKL